MYDHKRVNNLKAERLCGVGVSIKKVFIIECLWETKLKTKRLDVSTPPSKKSNYMNFKYSENETIREKALKTR